MVDAKTVSMKEILAKVDGQPLRIINPFATTTKITNIKDANDSGVYNGSGIFDPTKYTTDGTTTPTNGRTPYLHIAYADSADGKDGFYVGGGGTNLLIGTSEDEVSGKSYDFANYQISGGLQPGTTYTLSGWARVDQKAMDNQQDVVVYAFAGDWSWDSSLAIHASLTSKYNKVTFTTPSGKQFNPTVVAYLYHPNNDPSQDSISGTAYISKLKLEKGSVATPWSPAPSEAHPTYMGIYTDYTQADSLDPTSYLWSRIKGDKGAKGDKGDKGDDAVINIISQADYDALSDKSGVYFIEG